MCTVSPSQAVALAAKVKAARPDVTLVDAPVSGGTPRAASGDLTILASGLGEKNGKALYVLDKLSATQGNTENLFIIPGGAGMGAAVKLVNQHLAGKSAHLVDLQTADQQDHTSHVSQRLSPLPPASVCLSAKLAS